MMKPSKRKIRKSPVLDPRKMQEERRQFYQGLREIESIKKAFYAIEEKVQEDTTEVDEVLYVLSSHADSHPGKKIFKKKFRYQCFTEESLDYQGKIFSLQTKLIYHEQLSEIGISHLFYIMSLEEDEDVCHSCYEMLISNVATWTPKLADIFKVFYNWGASSETLALSELEKSIIFPSYFCTAIQPRDSITNEFLSFHYQNVFSYLGEVLRFSKFGDTELVILLKYFTKITLDKNMISVISIVKGLIGACVDAIRYWDLFKILHVSNIIHDKDDHFHNQVAMVMDIIPKKSRSNYISSCLSFAILRLMTKNELIYQYPFKDEEILELMKTLKIDPNSGEDLYKLYVTIHLLNHILCQRDMADLKPGVLKELNECVESFKWELAKSRRVFDAYLLKGRISYCSAMWSLMHKRSSKSNLCF